MKNKIVDFKEAYAAAQDAHDIDPNGGDYAGCVCYLNEKGELLSRKSDKKMTFGPAVYAAKWEILEKVPVNIEVWGICDEDGDSFIYHEKPTVKTHGCWSSNCDCLHLEPLDNMFPSDKPVKYILTPAPDQDD